MRYVCFGNADIVFFAIVLDLVHCTLELFNLLDALFCFDTYVCYICFSIKRFELVVLRTLRCRSAMCYISIIIIIKFQEQTNFSLLLLLLL